MNNRVLLVAAGLAIPLVALIVFTQLMPHQPANDATKQAGMSSDRPHKGPGQGKRQGQAQGAKQQQAKPGQLTLQDRRKQVRQHIQDLKKMTPQQFEAKQLDLAKKNPNHVIITLEQAQHDAQDRLDALKTMTPEQWNAQQKKLRQKRRTTAKQAKATAAPAVAVPTVPPAAPAPAAPAPATPPAAQR